MIARPAVTAFFEPDTGSVQYVVADPATGKAAILDAVWNLDPRSGRTSTEAADEILTYVRREGLEVVWILDTHPHADHLMAASYLKDRLGAPIGIGARTGLVTEIWRQTYNVGAEVLPDADRVWDRLFEDGDSFTIGRLTAGVMLSAGHTLASVTYLIGEAAFVHDTLFQPDQGTARTDFPGSDARTLWRSIRAILELPEATRTFTGHDYQPGGRDPAWESTVAEQRRTNIHLGAGQTEEGFVRLRTERDATLGLPRRMLMAMLINLRGGRKPEPAANGISYVPLPLDAELHAPVDAVLAATGQLET